MKTAERDAGIIEREKMPWGARLGLLVRAGLVIQCRRTKDALRLLSDAETALEAADMALYAGAAWRRRGELTGGDEG